MTAPSAVINSSSWGQTTRRSQGPRPPCCWSLRDNRPATVTYGDRSSNSRRTSSARSSPSPSLNTVTTSPYTNGQSRHSSARLALSHTDVEGPFRVKKAEQQQQLLATADIPIAAGVPSTNTHPAWRRAKGLDTSWRSNASSHREEDDNTTTSGSYTINHDDVREDGYNPDIMV